MKKILSAIVLSLWCSFAVAQTSPGLQQGQVLTPTQWNQLFINKQDALGFIPLNIAGGTMIGRLITAAPGTTTAGLNMIPGTTPAVPVNGDLWMTTAGLFIQVNGSTIGPLGTAACPTCAVINATNTFTAYQIINLNAAAIDVAQTGTLIQSGQADGVIGRLEVDTYGMPAALTGLRSDGTKASPTALVANDEIIAVNAWGYDGTTRASTAGSSVRQYAAGAWSNTSHPAYIDFSTTAIGSTTLTSRMHVESDGGITIGGTTSQGSGTLNVSGLIYANGTAPTGTGGYVRANSPALVTPSLGVASGTSLALGGATIGGNALAVTGTTLFNSSIAYGGVTLANSVTGTGSMVLATAPTISSLSVTTAFTATGLVTFADMASAAVATSANVISGAANVLVPASAIYPAETATTFGATTTFDFSTFINTAVTLTGNITTMTLSNVKAGQAGQIRFIQDATGSRTTAWNTILKFPGGTTPILSTTASAVDALEYNCISSSYCVASLIANVK